MATILQHDISYYGEDRYDRGANQVYASPVVKQLKSKNPFDDDDFLGTENCSGSSDEDGKGTDYRPSLSLDDSEPAKTDSDGWGSLSKLKRLSSLSKLIPNKSKLLPRRSSWAKMEDDEDTTEEKSQDEGDIFETTTRSRLVKKRSSLLIRFGK